MIISASKRNDIPAFFSDWFFNRIREGYAQVPNPMNCSQISKVLLTPDKAEAIVFWTKNATPMVERHWEDMKALWKRIPFYFTFSINPYGKVFEPNVPPMETTIDTFKKISNEFGKDAINWRYDPIIFSDELHFTEDYHAQKFEELAEKLADSTDECIISYLDDYTKTQRNMPKKSYRIATNDEQISLGKKLVAIARKHGIKLSACAEKEHLRKIGIQEAKCIDPDRIEKITSRAFTGRRRDEQATKRNVNGEILSCGCAPSIDIGSPDTCLHGCKYCYATSNKANAERNVARHNPESPLLVGTEADLTEGYKITIHSKMNKKMLG